MNVSYTENMTSSRYQNRTMQTGVLAIVFIYVFKFFQSTPLESIFFQTQAVFLLFAAFFLAIFAGSALISKKRINGVALYYIFLILVLPIYSASRAAAEFGQPFIYGVLSERGWLLIGAGIWLFYMLKTNKLALSTLKSAFVFMAWASLVIFSVFNLFIDAERLSELDEASRFVQFTDDRGVRFKFQTYFITFGVIYYFLKYSKKRSFLDLIFFVLFLSYILFAVQKRLYIIIVTATLLMYVLFNYPLNKLVLAMAKTFFGISLALIALIYFMPDYVERMSYLFAQILTVATGQLSEDHSANARLYASYIVLDYFNYSPMSLWFGTGKVSYQWNNGYESIFGYFYPEDIGILGGVFVYGILGMCFIYVVPLYIAIRTLKNVLEKEDVFVNSIRYLLIFALLASLHGTFYIGYMTYIIPLFVLLAYKVIAASRVLFPEEKTI